MDKEYKCPACERFIAPEFQPQEPTDGIGAEFECPHCGRILYDVDGGEHIYLVFDGC